MNTTDVLQLAVLASVPLAMLAAHVWLRYRRRATPTTPPQQDPHELRIMSAWGHTPASWAGLTPQQRTKAREDYTKAPRYVG